MNASLFLVQTQHMVVFILAHTKQDTTRKTIHQNIENMAVTEVQTNKQTKVISRKIPSFYCPARIKIKAIIYLLFGKQNVTLKVSLHVLKLQRKPNFFSNFLFCFLCG